MLHLPVQNQTFLKETIRFTVLALQAFKQAQQIQRPGNLILNLLLPKDRQCLFQQGASFDRVTSRPGNSSQQVEGKGDAGLVAKFPVKRQTLLAQ